MSQLKTFTITEIATYLISWNTIDQALNNLSPENISKAIDDYDRKKEIKRLYDQYVERTDGKPATIQQFTVMYDVLSQEFAERYKESEQDS